MLNNYDPFNSLSSPKVLGPRIETLNYGGIPIGQINRASGSCQISGMTHPVINKQIMGTGMSIGPMNNIIPPGPMGPSLMGP